MLTFIFIIIFFVFLIEVIPKRGRQVDNFTENLSSDLGIMRSFGADSDFVIAVKPRLIGKYELKVFLDEKGLPIDLNLLDKTRLMRT